jgi:hypothetical protein
VFQNDRNLMKVKGLSSEDYTIATERICAPLGTYKHVMFSKCVGFITIICIRGGALRAIKKQTITDALNIDMVRVQYIIVS